MLLPILAAAACGSATVIHLGSIAVAAIRCRQRPLKGVPEEAPPVTVVRPLCRINAFERETLASTFALDYPQYEIIFCLAQADDPVAPLVRELMAAHPQVPSRLVFGDDRRSANPKLNNVLKGWDAARHSWIILADSNVLMPRDYIQRLTTRWQPKSGLVCSMPIGSRPASFGAMVECAFLSTFQARWQYVGETFGLGFAQGKSMLFRRDIIDRAGGLLKALGAEIAEDAAVTKLVRGQGLRVHLVANPFEQPLGHRSLAEVWSRQRRWAVLRRKTFPLLFAPELISGALLPWLLGLVAALGFGINLAAVLVVLAVVWIGAEVALARIAGWPISAGTMLAIALRDLLLPMLCVSAWLSDGFVWRGDAMTVQTEAGKANASL
jgi:ceramide glucosyltransferase